MVVPTDGKCEKPWPHGRDEMVAVTYHISFLAGASHCSQPVMSRGNELLGRGKGREEKRGVGHNGREWEMAMVPISCLSLSPQQDFSYKATDKSSSQQPLTSNS